MSIPYKFWYTSVIKVEFSRRNSSVATDAQDDTTWKWRKRTWLGFKKTGRGECRRGLEEMEDSRRGFLGEDFYFLTRFTVGPSKSC